MTPAGAASAAPERARLADWLSLAKPRLSLMVVIAAAAGYWLGERATLDLTRALATLAGTFLAAGGAAALNMVLERDKDARMDRTRQRPLPAGRLSPAAVQAYGVALSMAGVLLLALTVGLLPAAVASATLAGYLFAYTPLKTRTSLNTLVGAVPGALPPLIGWTAARGELDAGGWVLFALLFLWQIPHFLAIAWVHRADYERAGMPMLSVLDPEGRATGRQMTVYTTALVAASLLPVPVGLAGGLYLAGALPLGILFLGASARFGLAPSRERARQVFLYSLLYLPLVLGLLAADKRGG